MPRPRSQKVEDIKRKLQTRLTEGIYRAGERFISARELADNFGISYQTADRLINELCAEGYLERRAASGTYIPGGVVDLTGVQLFWNKRARRAGSFGARLLEGLTERLKRDRIDWKVTWTDVDNASLKIPRNRLPVLWESPAAASKCAEANRSALLLNDRPPPGLAAAFLDSVSLDDFSGGVCAAQLLLRGSKTNTTGFAVLTGPADDERSNERRDGFLSIVPQAKVIVAGSWFTEDGYAKAAQAVTAGQTGLFCCNDRLAEAIITYCQDNGLAVPRIVGFDDAPVSEQLNLTTIAIPWDEMIAGAVGLIKRRLTGDSTVARQLVLTPRPVIRNI